ncbi:MAG: dienelactone hydrolase family protein [Bacteroidales bacterium]|nr:dienelactone hydrolase family protein [Bacteroidales bacterium]
MKRLAAIMLFISLAWQIFAQEYALKKLEESPRHSEWVRVKSGERNINCFVVYPEIAKKAPVIVVIHENTGLTDWARSLADQLAAEGYIAIAPDLLSDFGPGKSKTSDFSNTDEARTAIYALDPDQVLNDLNAVEKFAESIPAGNGKTAAMGFCWGGSQCFRFATSNSGIKAALVFYGSSPSEADDIRKINVPVYGFYGGNDQRVNAGIPDTEKLMKENNKKYEYVIYPGAGHGFMRQGDDPSGSPENKNARNEAWLRIKTILEGI